MELALTQHQLSVNAYSCVRKAAQIMVVLPIAARIVCGKLNTGACRVSESTECCGRLGQNQRTGSDAMDGEPSVITNLAR